MCAEYMGSPPVVCDYISREVYLLRPTTTLGPKGFIEREYNVCWRASLKNIFLGLKTGKINIGGPKLGKKPSFVAPQYPPLNPFSEDPRGENFLDPHFQKGEKFFNRGKLKGPMRYPGGHIPWGPCF